MDYFTDVSGQILDLPDGAKPIDYFKLFNTDSLITKIMEQTNLYAEQCQAKKGVDKYLKRVSEVEMNNCLFINFMFGIIKLL